jgi:predicted nucleic acid-binding protein
MKFPISELDRQKYFDEIYKLLEDDDCQIFIDTNIIALFYRIYDSARKEFFDWISILIQKDRVKTPLWALNEYTNRFIRNQLEDYLSPLKKVNTINKDFLEVSNFLKMNIDSSSLKGTKYSDLKDFLNDLTLVEEKLKNITVTARSKDENYKLKIHNEIQSHFEKTVLNSSLDIILSKIHNFGGVRYSHKLPPGFQDGEKDLNSYGDLIIWNEILEHCKNTGVKKAILMTNDAKKDWVYAPNKIIENSRSIVNKAPQLKIADPRLVYEFKSHTDSEDFYIITFDLLTQILILNSKVNFIQLANALQIAHKQDLELLDEEIESNDEAPIETDLSESKTEISESSEAIELSKKSYSQSALADSEFPLYDESFLTEIIINLKTQNWYVQNPALEQFLSSNINSIEENKDNSDKLFVIGRNIYQAACGSSAAAVDFIHNLKLKLSRFNDYAVNHIYSGLLYEIYFDAYNNFRTDLKSNYISEVLSLKDLPRLKPSIDFINEMIEPFKESLFYLPSSDKKVELEIIIDKDIIENEDWLGIITQYREIISLTANGKNLLTTNDNESLEIYYQSMDIKEVIRFICVSYAIPENQIIILNPEVLNEQANITFGHNKLKKISFIEKN